MFCVVFGFNYYLFENTVIFSFFFSFFFNDTFLKGLYSSFYFILIRIEEQNEILNQPQKIWRVFRLCKRAYSFCILSQKNAFRTLICMKIGREIGMQ